MTRQALIYITSAWLFFAACTARTAPVSKRESGIIPVKIIPLSQYNQFASVSVSGQFTTDDETLLSFKTGGIVNKILVKEGDLIHHGQLLATLNLTEINAGVEQAQLAQEKAARDYRRITNLYNDSVATLEQLQNIKTALDLATQQLNTAHFNRNFSEIRATGDGYVLHKMANEGQYLSAGTPVLQTNGARSAKWQLRCGVTDKQWASLQVGDKATVVIGSNTSEMVQGVLSRKSEGVDVANGLFTVDIQVSAHTGKTLATGMFGNATIIPAGKTLVASHVQGPWAIPYDALLDGDGSTGYVFVTNDNKMASRVKVVIASIEKDKVIISQGLNGANSLIVSGSAYLTDSTPINIIP